MGSVEGKARQMAERLLGISRPNFLDGELVTAKTMDDFVLWVETLADLALAAVDGLDARLRDVEAVVKQQQVVPRRRPAGGSVDMHRQAERLRAEQRSHRLVGGGGEREASRKGVTV